MREATSIVSNTGPLISMEKMDRGYDFIRRLYGQVIIPPTVLAEVAADTFETPQAYLQHYGIVDLIEVRSVPQSVSLPEIERLHQGEIEAIQLALALQLPLLIEETVGRRVAQQVGLRISGMAGQITAALRRNVISTNEARRQLGALLRGGRINRNMYNALIADVSSSSYPPSAL